MTKPIKSGCAIVFISLLSACAKEPSTDATESSNSPPDKVIAGATAEDEVKWEDFDSLSLPVDKMGCPIEEGVATHCHPIVERDQSTGALVPDRTLLMARNGNKYSLAIVSLAKPEETVACIDLPLKNPQTIEGTCAVTGDPATGLTHNFQATIERMPSGKIRVKFAFRHAPFGSNEPLHHHNGDGHATEP